MLGNGSDIGRMKRQQAFIAAMAHQVLSANTLARPDRLLKFLEAATESLQLDEGLGSLAKIAKLGVEFKGIGLDKIQFITVPWQYAPDDPNRIRWLPEAEQVWQAIINDKPIAAEVPRATRSAPSSCRARPRRRRPTRRPRAARRPVRRARPGTPTTSPTDEPTDGREAEDAIENGLCA